MLVLLKQSIPLADYLLVLFFKSFLQLVLNALILYITECPPVLVLWDIDSPAYSSASHQISKHFKKEISAIIPIVQMEKTEAQSS